MSFSPQSLWMGIESLLEPASLLTLGVRGVLLLAAAALLVRVAFKASAATRHLIWAMAMVALLLLPVLSTTLPALQVQGPEWLARTWRWIDREPTTQVASVIDAEEPAQTNTPTRAWSFNASPQGAVRAVPVQPEETVAPAPLSPEARRLQQNLRRQERQTSRTPSFAGETPAQSAPAAGAPVLLQSAVNEPTQEDNAATSPLQAAAGWLLPLWLVGLVGVAGWFALQHWSVRWLTMHAVEVEEGELVDLMHRLRHHIDLRRPVRLLVGHRTMMPMTWGVFRPVVLLPDNITEWPTSRQEDVLLHELAHIKRRDHLSQVLAQIGCAVHWFNPLTWYAVRRMTLEREHACDDYVLNSGTRPSDYATNLLEVARSMKRGPVTSMAAIAMAGRSTLKDRLQAVLDDGRTRNTLGRRLATLSLLLIGALAIPLATLEVVSIDPVQAAGPRVGERGTAPIVVRHSNRHRDRDVHHDQHVDHDVHVDGTWHWDHNDGDYFLHGGASDPLVMIHDGQRIELPYVDPDEVLAIVGANLRDLEDIDLDEHYDAFRSIGEEIGAAFRELEYDDELPFRYFAIDDESRAAVQERLEELSDRLSDMSVFVQPDDYAYYVSPDRFPSRVRAPRPPRSPRPPRAVVAPRVDVAPFQVADGSWAYRSNGKSNWTWNDGDDRMSLRTRGEVVFNEDGTDVESLSPRGYFEYEVEEGRTDYRVRFRADRDGEITREWWVDGDKREFDEEARTWMATAMPELLRRTGFNAEQRVEAILEEKGVEGVLEEIDTLDSDHVIRLYFTELLSQAKLDSGQYKRVFEIAGDSIGSDFELATLLANSAKRTNLDEDAILEYARATRTIGSDFESRRALTALVHEQKLTPEGVEAVLEASMDIGSDFELASFLTELAKEHPEAYQSSAFLDALDSVGSDFEQRRVLTNMVKDRDLSPESLARALQMGARGIGSDFELAEFLSTAARVHEIKGDAVAPYLEAMESIGSDFEYRRAATAAIRRGEMDVAGVTELVRIAGDNVGSDFELSQLLQEVADNYDVEGELREAYLEASDSINSRHESQRALDAIDAR